MLNFHGYSEFSLHRSQRRLEKAERILGKRVVQRILAFALYLAFNDPIIVSYFVNVGVPVPGMEGGSGDIFPQPEESVAMRLTPIMLSIVPALLLAFPVVVLWRLVRHRIAIYRVLGYGGWLIPSWVLWLATIVCTVLIIVWIFILFLL